MRFLWVVCLLVPVGGILVLLGWATGTEVLYRPTPNAPVITPWTAACFTALGVAIFGQSRRKYRWGKGLAIVGGTVVLGAISVMLGEYAIGNLPGFDTLLFPSRVSGLPMDHPGRPSVRAITVLLALTCASWGALFKDKWNPLGRWIEGLVWLSAAIALLALFGYAFSMPVLLRFPHVERDGTVAILGHSGPLVRPGHRDD